jgi:glycosyltransferase involved in cell wall biosynthesis
MKICMFVKNSISHDPRVKREAPCFVKAGHDVTVIGETGEGCAPDEIWEGVRFLRVPEFGPFWHNVARVISWRRRWQRIKRLFGKGEYLPAQADAQAVRPKVSGASAPDAPAVPAPLFTCFDPVAYNPGWTAWPARLRGWIKEMFYFGRWIRFGVALKADVYHAHDLDTLFIAQRCAKRRKAKLVYDSHELWLEWHQNKLATDPKIVREWAVTESRLIHKADIVVTVSDGVAEELSKAYGIPRPLVVRNCEPLRPLEKSSLLRERIGGDPRRPVFLYQGSFVYGRGLEELVAVAGLVPEVDFVLMGWETKYGYKAKIQKIAEGNRNGNLHILPHVERDKRDELFAVTCSADAGLAIIQPVCKSFALSLANKIFEYMAAGVPIIASAIQGHQALAQETGALALVDPSSVEDMVRVIRGLASDRERMCEMGRRAREWAEKKYNAEHEMAQLVAAYEELAVNG